MRILVVGQQTAIMLDDMKRNAKFGWKFNFVRKSATNGPDEMQFHHLTKREDLERMRGQRFDLIVEHPTFNAFGLLSELRTMVLR
jgi:hypothetical protein